jgi:hypothetical protein
MTFLAAYPILSPWAAYLLWWYTSSSTSRVAFRCPRNPLWSGPAFWIQGRWVMNCLLALFVSLCGPDKQFIRPPFSLWVAYETKDDALDSMKWVEQIIKLLLRLNSCYEWPNCCLCFVKDCSCCNCLGGNWNGWYPRLQLKGIRRYAGNQGRICLWNCCNRDFMMQGSALVCSSWRDVWYVKVAVLIPTAAKQPVSVTTLRRCG